MAFSRREFDHQPGAGPYALEAAEALGVDPNRVLKTLIVAATDDSSLHERVHFDALEHNIPINVVDTPSLCTFIFPAIVDRSPIVIGISSGGESPVLVRLLRARCVAT